MIDLMQALTLAVGSTGLGGAIVAIRKARPETRKMDADTAAVIATTAGKWVQEADDRMDELAAQLKTVMADQRRQDELLVVHARWDRQILSALDSAGIDHLPKPPPLHLPQTG